MAEFLRQRYIFISQYAKQQNLLSCLMVLLLKGYKPIAYQFSKKPEKLLSSAK